MKNFLKKFFPLLLVLLVLFVWFQHLIASSDDAPNLSLSAERWREDLRHLAAELPRRHHHAFHTVSPEEFTQAVAELDADIPTLDGDEIMARLLQLTALIGDARTDLRLPQNLLRRFPLELYWFGAELRVVRTSPDLRAALGTRVTQINGHAIDDVLANVSAFITRENEQWVQCVSADYISCAEILRASGMMTEKSRARWTFADDDGKEIALELDAVSCDEKTEWVSARKPSPSDHEGNEKDFWFTTLDHAKTVYVNFQRYPERAEFKRVCQELLETLERDHPRRLIIDLRGNGGGDFTLVRRHLLPQLREQKFLDRPLSFFVITDRATQSAAVINAADFWKMSAVFVGEPTGGRPNGYFAEKIFKLPNSHLEISYATKYCQGLDDDTPALIPHKKIEQTWQAYVSGKDLAMAWIQQEPYR